MSIGLSHRPKNVSSVYNSFRSKNNAPIQILFELMLTGNKNIIL